MTGRGALLAAMPLALLVSATGAATEGRDCSREVCLGAGVTDGGFGIGGSVGGPGAGAGAGASPGHGVGGPTGPLHLYAYTPACSGNGPPPGNADLCVAATISCEDGEIRLWVFRRELDAVTREPSSPWQRLPGTICVDGDDTGAPAIARLPGLVREEWRDVDLAPSRVRYQPRDGGVVNIETVFHADTPATIEIPVGEILGYDVTITARATEYRWSWGDGTSSTTRGPGAPYPSRDVTHVYRSPGRFAVSVTVTYEGTYSVDGGPAQPISGTVSVPGPATGVPVREARAELVDGEAPDG